MTKPKGGIAFIFLGFFLPLVLLPFASGYDPQAGLLLNIQRMELVLFEEKRKPTFEPSEGKPRTPLERLLFEVEVPLGDKKIIVEFPTSTSQSEMEEVLNAEFPQGKKIPAGEYADRMLFSGYKRVRERMAIPYRYPFTFSILLVFGGIMVIILAGPSKRGS